MARTVNSELLRQLILTKEPMGLERVALGTGVSTSSLYKLQGGYYPNPPKQETREAICKYFNIKEDILFPKIETDNE